MKTPHEPLVGHSLLRRRSQANGGAVLTVRPMLKVGMCDTLHWGVWYSPKNQGSRIVMKLISRQVAGRLAVAPDSQRWSTSISSALPWQQT
jgi:hypothetical protein